MTHQADTRQADGGSDAVTNQRTVRDQAARAARMRRAAIWGGRLGRVVVILGGWQLCTSKIGGNKPLVDPFFYGQPSGIWKRLVDLFQHGTEFGSYWLQIETTLKEAVFGFLIGAVTGIVFGVALGQSRFLAEVIGPFIKVFNAIPRIVLGSIFIVAFGVGMTPKVLLAAVLVFFIVFFNAFQGVREVDRNIIANARVLGASPLEIVRHVTLPSALTWIIASLHTAFGFAIVGALVAEVLGAQAGLGLVIKTAQGNFDPNGVFAVMLTVSVITLVAEFILTRLERRLLSWRPPSLSDTPAI
jgi:NitT/TauT family transport system permease protein